MRLSKTSDKGFKRDCGWALNTSGERKAKRFWLGHDKSLAAKLTTLIDGEWSAIRLAQPVAPVWTTEALARIETAKLGKSSSASQPEPSWTLVETRTTQTPSESAKPLYGPPIAIGDIMLYEATKKFHERELERYRNKQISIDQANKADTFLVGWMPHALPDMPLTKITAAELETAVGKITARPPNRRRGGNGDPIAVATVENILKAFRCFFIWAKKGKLWVNPFEDSAELDEVFRPDLDKLKTEMERADEEEDIPVFSMTTLAKQWRRMVPRDRLFWCLGLQCGFYQSDISHMLERAVVQQDGEWFIKRGRSKTHHKGEWWLWPETAKLLQEFLEHGRADGLALVGNNGNPLQPLNGKRGCVVSKAWERLQDTFEDEDEKHSFSTLRDTGANLLRKIDGEEVAQMYMAQKKKSIAEKHYLNRDFARLTRALKAMHRQLTEANVFVNSTQYLARKRESEDVSMAMEPSPV